MIGTRRRLVGLAAAAAVVAAACGGGDDDGDAVSEGDDEAAPAAPDGDDAAPEEGDGEAAATATVAQGWTSTIVGDGIKPTLALDSAGTPAAVWLSEEIEGGFVDFASAGDDWTPLRVAEGYFYGPIDVAFDAEDRPNVVWHDHEDVTFDQAKGNLAYGLLEGDAWAIEPAENDGHDGWDSTLVVADDGTVFAAGIDPAQFQRQDGVEFYERTPEGAWTVTPVGSGPIEYEFNVGLALSPDGTPALSWFDPEQADLVYAERVDGEWQLETVASEGDVGRYSSLAFDAQGRPHLSFFEADETDSAAGRILYAVRDGGQWTVEEVGALTDYNSSNSDPTTPGARRNSVVAVGPDDTVQVAFTDKSTLQLATRADDGTWTPEELLTAGDQDLGQQVSLKLDADGTPHVATYEVTGLDPVQRGAILYLTPA